MTARDLDGAVWRKSARSGGNGGNCVEVATNLPHIVAMRDTKDRAGGTLTFNRSGWTAFLEGVKGDTFDR
ncbi:DUF397 domain-containing protein [Actinoplanes sp. NPDC026619]|uniref:DUF397 domain-containing protein n=1 Tax=Actinoplanes sp. NPDC026619 TaxID=3155798 RepID=UPI00340C3D1D